MIPPEEFLKLRQDVKDIKNYMTGNEAFGVPGVIGKQKEHDQRLKEVEERQSEMESKMKQYIAYASGAVGTIVIIIDVVSRFLIH